ncbi:hypothetical protein HHI36_019509 [Cryptolaemus montrouzieri]|uniref:Uncharacterized protein n=1 Tax=Cryptolaemus montrouzieri TaxID=559131 RepID=A0ABD2P427_9CUCU
MRIKCLELWRIPDLSKKTFVIDNEIVNDLLVEFVLKTDWLKVPAIMIENEERLKKIFETAEDWSFCALYSSTKRNVCNFYAGFGTRTCKWQNGKWIKVKNLKLTRGTLLYGELVKEVVCSNKSDEEFGHSFRYSFHIIDAIYLGNIYLINHKFHERMELINMYAESINQEFQEKQVHIRKKPIISVTNLHSSIIWKHNNNISSFTTILPTVGFNSVQESQDVNSMLFMKHREDHSLQSTFVLRVQLCLEEVQDTGLFNILINHVKESLDNRVNRKI